MTLPTIQEDVEQQETNGEIEEGQEIQPEEGSEEKELERPKSARDLEMERIFQKRSKMLSDKSGESDELNEGIEDDDDNYDDNYGTPNQDTVTLKVNGQQIVKPRSEVEEAGGIVAMQKAMSGDMKLKEAAAQRKVNEQQSVEIENIKAENLKLRNEFQQLQQSQSTENIQEDDEATIRERSVKAKDYSKKLFSGDTEDLEEVMEVVLKAADNKRVVVQQTQPQINQQQLTQEVKATLKFEASRDKAVDYFEKEHSDLNTTVKFDDGSTFNRRSFVNDVTAEMSNQHPDWSPEKIMRESVKHARTALNLPKPQKNPRGLNEKAGRKRQSADPLPQASQRRDAPHSDNKRKTPREIFEDVTKGRSHNM